MTKAWAKQLSDPRFVLFTAQKNEGPFLLEWVAYHRQLGFDKIIVVSNDCDDGSDELADALDSAGAIAHLRQTVPENVPPQTNAERMAREADLFQFGDWVIWLDLDEFLLPHPKRPTLRSIVDAIAPAKALMIAWRFFGDSGNKTWPGRHVGPDFVRAAARRRGRRAQVKTLFQYGPQIEKLDIHRPVLVQGTTQSEFPVVTSADVPADPSFWDYRRRRGFNRMTGAERPYVLGQVAHFCVRTPDAFALKSSRGDGYFSDPQAVARDANFYNKKNFNDVEELELSHHADATESEMKRLLRSEYVAHAENRVQANFLRKTGEPAIAATSSQTDPAEELPEIASLWIGGNLSFLEQLCLKSFVDKGHPTTLFCYEEIGNIPKGVRIEDASEIMPRTRFITNKASGSPAPHADRFRYLLLQKGQHIWVDTDAYCVKPFPNTDFVFAPHFKTTFANGVLRLPPESKTLRDLIAFTDSEYPELPPDFIMYNRAARERHEERQREGKRTHISEMAWDTWRPHALTYFLKRNGEDRHALPSDALYPLQAGEIARVLQKPFRAKIDLPPDCLSVHFYGSAIRKKIFRNGGAPQPKSFLAKLCRQHDIDIEAAPIVLPDN